jgi:uncharacterized protein
MAMKFTNDKVPGNFINSYLPGEIHLRDQVLTAHAIISTDQVFADWQPADFDNLSIADFKIALDLQPEILLFGTGVTQRFPELGLMTEIMRAGTAIEVMQTAAACRTFNVLISENRSVIAALLVN